LIKPPLIIKFNIDLFLFLIYANNLHEYIETTDFVVGVVVVGVVVIVVVVVVVVVVVAVVVVLVGEVVLRKLFSRASFFLVADSISINSINEANVFFIFFFLFFTFFIVEIIFKFKLIYYFLIKLNALD